VLVDRSWPPKGWIMVIYSTTHGFDPAFSRSTWLLKGSKLTWIMRTMEWGNDKSFIVGEDALTQHRSSSSTSITTLLWSRITILPCSRILLCIFFFLLDFWFLLWLGLCNPKISRRCNFVAYIKDHLYSLFFYNEINENLLFSLWVGCILNPLSNNGGMPY